MTAREWKPGDKALVEVEVTWTDGEGDVQCSIGDDEGYFLPVNVLRPVPAAGEAATENVIERAARVLARLDPGEDWPTNEALGGSPTGTRDDEYRAAMLDQARDLARAGLLADGGRSEAEIKAEALREAAEAMRLAKEPGHRYLLDLLDADVIPTPDVWLERRAARLAKEADQ